LNLLAVDAGDLRMGMALSFTNQERVYELNRVAEFRNPQDLAPKIRLDLRIDGEPMPLMSIDEHIGRVLHPKVSEFFLFDGEMLSDFNARLNQNREREELLKRVEQVLGVPALQLALSDVEELRARARALYEKSIKDRQESVKIKERFDREDERYQGLMRDRAQFIEVYGTVKEQLASLKDELAALLGTRAASTRSSERPVAAPPPDATVEAPRGCSSGQHGRSTEIRGAFAAYPATRATSNAGQRRALLSMRTVAS
jgi:DNA sulfur modification protein DndD